MIKKRILPVMITTLLLGGCSAGEMESLQSDVEAIKQEVAALKEQIRNWETTTTNVATQLSGSGEPAAVQQKDLFELGEPFEYEGVTYTFTEGERKQKLGERLAADEGQEFIVINSEIHNTSGEDYKYSQTHYSIVTGSGEIKRNYLIIDTRDQYDDLGNGDLAPDGKRSGWIAFEVPQGDQPAELRFELHTLTSQSTFKVKLK
ncbi:DUF4352 domain-containing protein [Paenibacillus lemnae]|uniref:DUF4352 domain-containing protein n=1 Tax=Paenibacillus lemnae TaxID=1330551 RepID=A0A848M229_PAELE|nr:DUF4352 domain-containing protein [Paenibacillus lemnae]NMO94311.1 DUF4352 domain-containing protein [Paenibacillus lemnae]